MSPTPTGSWSCTAAAALRVSCGGHRRSTARRPWKRRSCSPRPGVLADAAIPVAPVPERRGGCCRGRCWCGRDSQGPSGERRGAHDPDERVLDRRRFSHACSFDQADAAMPAASAFNLLTGTDGFLCPSAGGSAGFLWLRRYSCGYAHIFVMPLAATSRITECTYE